MRTKHSQCLSVLFTICSHNFFKHFFVIFHFFNIINISSFFKGAACQVVQLCRFVSMVIIIILKSTNRHFLMTTACHPTCVIFLNINHINHIYINIYVCVCMCVCKCVQVCASVCVFNRQLHTFIYVCSYIY
jgi:hypothetical protein